MNPVRDIRFEELGSAGRAHERSEPSAPCGPARDGRGRPTPSRPESAGAPAALAFLLFVAAVTCVQAGGSSSRSSTSPAAVPAAVRDTGADGGPARTRLGDLEEEALRAALDEELRAWTTYDQVLVDLGPVPPCEAAAEAEAARGALLGTLLERVERHDLREVLERLRRAALERHAPAFRRRAALGDAEAASR